MIRIDIPALQIFVAAVEEKSLSKAAEHENIVTSAASKRMIELERQLGVVVLTRHGRGVEPTPAGIVLYQRAKAILRGVQLAAKAVAEFAPTGIAKIRLAANRSTMVQFMPTVISRYLARTPDTRIDLLERLSFDIPRLVAEGEADLGIYHAVKASPGVTSYPFRTDHVVLVVPRGHPLAGKGALFLEDAIDYDFVGYFPRHSFEAFMELAERSISRPLNVRVQVTNFEARCRMVSEGLGLAIVPEDIARTQRLDITWLTLKDDWATRLFYLCVRDAAQLTPAVADLLKFLIQSGKESTPSSAQV
jgi:DNA-binding transcriptional LysR family regulator